MPVEDEKEKTDTRGGNQAISQHLQSSASATEVLSATAPDEKDDPEWDAFMRRTGRFMNSGERR